jgi:NosR/NirI family transcriptional regulator, nitrous oxide reductase regulator
MRYFTLLVVCFVFYAFPAHVETISRGAIPLIERLNPNILAGVFQAATRVEALEDGGPVAVAAYNNDQLIGYVFSTLDVVRAPGYSSIPFDVVGGVTLDGRITGAAVLFHREPHLTDEPDREAKLVQFLGNMKGMEARMGALHDGYQPSFVAGATISARAMRNAILESSQLVLRYRAKSPIVTEPTIDMLNFRPLSVPELVADGGLVNVVITNRDLGAAMTRAGLDELVPEVLPEGDLNAIYCNFFIGLAMPPTIGVNSAGKKAHEVLEHFTVGSQGLIFGSKGTYNYRRTELSLTRVLQNHIVVSQGSLIFDFAKYQTIKANYKLGLDASILVLPPNSDFNPLQAWHTDIFANALRKDGTLERFVLASVDYNLPAHYVILPEADPMPSWMEAWFDAKTKIATLITALAVLTLILARQSAISRSRSAHRWIRNSFLIFTLIWIGWIASAQLSIVHIINYIRAPFESFEYGFYLAEPLIVIISAYTAVSLILLGRGVFCGWLCPFGALQDLLAQTARALALPQWNPSASLQKLLWNGKYVSLALIVALAFLAPAAGSIATEIEPFKTAITAMFVRGTPYVIYAAVLLMIGLFTERAFCRFICPLGGALALLDRLHLINMLKRRPECGNPCALCERSCPVKAIESSGKIKMSECFQCLDCQVEYYSDTRCPPLSKLRKQFERSNIVISGAPDFS